MGHLTAAHFKTILAKVRVKPTTYVETGCNRGDQLVVAAPHFARSFGIELDPRYAEQAQQRVPQAAVFAGDTSKLLAPLLRDLLEPVFIVLDAHYCALNPPIEKSPFPLWNELVLLRARTYPDIIVIDDVHTFGKVRQDLRFGDVPDWEGVTTASLSSFFGAKGEVIGDGYVILR